MINPGYKISVRDIKELKQFKRSEAYSTYLKAISKSPAFVSIMDEHINNINIEEDVSQLKKEGKLPSSMASKSVASLFKESLSRMAICILADSIILKELEDCKVDTVLNGLKQDSDIMYLLGKADKKYYLQAARLVEEGKLDSNSLAFRGLLAYMKLNNKEFAEPQEACKTLIEETQPTVLDEAPEVRIGGKVAPSIDLDSDDIIL
jgi:hypothetical protein